MAAAVSPLAPKSVPTMPAIGGVKMATAEAGIKYKNRTDLLFMIFDTPADVAGVLTRSKCPSAPVDHCRKALQHGKARGVVVNSGNANAFTGKTGKASTDKTAQTAAQALGCSIDEIYLASTGVIGEPLDADKFSGLLGTLVPKAQANQWHEAAKAIMTTDTFPKVATRQAMIGTTKVTINGIAKGAGMIAPDMATMLSFVVTDANIASSVLQDLLKSGTDKSFNCVTVDSDTSTSDTLLLFATGAAGNARIETHKNADLADFKTALDALLLDLAQQVARDGEGARKFIEVNVTGAVSDQSAKIIAMSIANSPLVKTAAAGEDANWGRVVMAVGKAGEEADRDKLSIWFGEHRLAVNGARDPDYSEEAASNYMKNSEIRIRADIGLGTGQATVWTCDLTKEYITINGDYRS